MLGLPANYWRLWGASAVSNLADGIFFIVLPLLAVRLTDSPILVAGVAIAGRLPWLFFVLIAGALADRLDRRRTMRNVQLLRVGVMGTLVVLALVDGLSLPILYVAALVLGIGETLFDTAAQSILPAVVEKDKLALANGRLYGAELVMNQFVGPPLGGLLIAISVPLALGSSVVGYALAAMGLTLVVGSFKARREGPPTRLTTDIAEGLRYLLRHRVLRTLALMVGVMNLAGAATGAILVLYAVSPGPMNLSEPEFGLFATTFAVGSVAGSIAAARMERRVGRIPLLFLCVTVSAVSFAVPAFTANVFLIAPAFVVSGVFVVVWNVITVSLRQRIIPDHLLGRVNSAYRLFAWGSQPVGALLGGLIGEALGLPAVFLLGGITTLLLLFTRTVLTEEAIVAAEAEAPAGPAPAAGTA
ncbi:MAG TPA: MFS transporter [Candidatus Limnocylindria bacterium]|nr:MFS transporter [Candidatus Limnocylindria bacterium]